MASEYTAAPTPLAKGMNVHVSVPVLMRFAPLYWARVSGLPLIVTPTAPATVTVPAPWLSSRSCVPVDHGTVASSGSSTATGDAFDRVTSFVKSAATN